MRVVSLQPCILGMGMAETLKSKQYLYSRKFVVHSSMQAVFEGILMMSLLLFNFCRETELLRENPLRNFPLNSLPR
jgi:hypothetical protein